MALLLVPAVLVIALSFASSNPTFEEISCQSNEICVDLNTNNGVKNLGNGISVWDSVTGVIDNLPCSRQAVFKVTFDKLPANADCLCHDTNPYGGRRMLKLQLYMAKTGRDGWMWDFGDSVSNNGWAGDAGDTEYEAEVQGAGITSISVYANNVNGTECRAQLLYGFPNGVSVSTNKVDIWIANHFLKIQTDGGLLTSHCDKCLFGLNGQYTPGIIDQDIYVAVNRVIDGSYRNGYGVCYLKMSWE